jgi:mycothiol synthase
MADLLATVEPYRPAIPLPPIPGLRFRHLRAPDDYPSMNSVANAARAAEGLHFFSSDADFANSYSHLSRCDPARDVVVVEVAERVIAYARSTWLDEHDGDSVYETICYLHPDWFRQGIGAVMLATTEARLREIAADHAPSRRRFFQAEASDLSPGRTALLLRAGYQPARHGYTMVRPTLDDQPDAPLPDGLEIRDVRPEHMRAIWTADQEAFRDHWGSGPGTEEDYLEFLNDPTQGDTSLWRIAWDGQEVAGQVRSFINLEENRRFGRRRGWVENISVGRPWRHRGLARALMAASFPLLRAHGMTEGALSVDAQNPTGASGVYQSVGFQTVSSETVFRKPIA